MSFSLMDSRDWENYRPRRRNRRRITADEKDDYTLRNQEPIRTEPREEDYTEQELRDELGIN